MLKLDRINERTASAFRVIAKCNETSGNPLEKMSLVGGTALSIRLGHRNSLDLDFATSEEKLNVKNISSLIQEISKSGVSCIDVTDAGAADEFANDGLDIADYQQDWLVGDVKVQFFTYGRNSVERDALDGDEVPEYIDGIKIASLSALIKTKSHVVCKRTKSRDLFDLYTLLKDGHTTIDAILVEMQSANPYLSYENLRHRLAEKPVRGDDEGLSPVGVHMPTEDIQRELANFLDDFESRATSDLAPR